VDNCYWPLWGGMAAVEWALITVAVWDCGAPIAALVFAVAGLLLAGVIARVWSLRRRNLALACSADEQRRAGEAQAERARWALMTHLSADDEGWLAERHFWATPTQVAMLRAGLDPQPDWQCYGSSPPVELRQLRQMQSRARAARAAFEGIRRTEGFTETALAA